MREVIKVKIQAGKMPNSWHKLCLQYAECYGSDPASV